MAAARGVVSTDVAGLPEMVDDGVTGRLVPPRDAVALAAGIIEGLADATSAAPRWGAAGWERVRAVYPLERWAARAADLLDTVAGPARASATAVRP